MTDEKPLEPAGTTRISTTCPCGCGGTYERDEPAPPSRTRCFHGEHCPHHTPPGRVRDALQAATLRATITAINLIGRHIDKHQETK